MKVIPGILMILLSYSCTKYAEINQGSGGARIEGINMEISHLNEIKWRVGLKKEVELTQSFTFIVSMPKLKKDDLDELTKTKGIDAWIIRLKAYKGSETRDLGSLYTLFRPRKLGRGVSGGAATSATVKVYYAAAYASERFRAFKCPAFGHNKKIKTLKIVGEPEPFEMPLQTGMSYREKSQLIELTPSSFNGGNDLAGDYYLEIAAYDSKNKMVHSDFKRLPETVSISNEEAESIPSCSGVHEELN